MSKNTNPISHIHKLIDKINFEPYPADKIVKRLEKIKKLVEKIQVSKSEYKAITNKPCYEVAIAMIESNFDFHQVRKAMLACDISWYLGVDKKGNSISGVPSLETIISIAFDCLSEAYNSESTISSESFTAYWDDNMLHLTFNLEQI